MRPKDTEYQKQVKKALKRLEKDLVQGKQVGRDVLAKNELLYHYVRYGMLPIKEAANDATDTESSGFKMVINSMFRKALKGDMRAIKMVMNMAGLDVDNVETDANTESNTFTLNYKL